MIVQSATIIDKRQYLYICVKVLALAFGSIMTYAKVFNYLYKLNNVWNHHK
jgi:hypothetical protein